VEAWPRGRGGNLRKRRKPSYGGNRPTVRGSLYSQPGQSRVKDQGLPGFHSKKGLKAARSVRLPPTDSAWTPAHGAARDPRSAPAMQARNLSIVAGGIGDRMISPRLAMWHLYQLRFRGPGGFRPDWSGHVL